MKDFARINHYGILMEKIVQFRTYDNYCDIDIRVKERTFKCHRLILGAVSTYFDRMFNGNFQESSAKEIILYHVEADLFENILRFVYEGDIDVINSSNVYSLMGAAHFYELPMLIEFCYMFVGANLNEVANDVLKIYAFAHNSAMKNFVELLSRHINENFHYFSKRPEFYELTIDQVDKVIESWARNGQKPVLEDAFHEGVYEWVARHVHFDAKDSASFERLQRKLDRNNCSVEYMMRFAEKLAGNANDEAPSTGNKAVETLPNNLYAFIAKRSNKERLSSSSTRIFSLQATVGVCMMGPRRIWISTGELEYDYDFLRTIVLDDRLYSLGYLKNDIDAVQTFTTGTSVPMYPYVSLKPPPLLLDEFDMCGTGDYIYVYCKKPFTSGIIEMYEGTKMSEGQLSFGMYMYKRDADEWLPLPYPRMRFNDACMTCDEKLVYLIGGTNSGGLVQTYDVRTREWSIIPPTTGVYENAACCVAGDKVYVAGGQENARHFEMYDPVSGRWDQLNLLPDVRYDKHQLLHFSRRGTLFHDDGIVNFSNRVSPRSMIVIYDRPKNENSYAGNWHELPHVLDFVKYDDRTLTDRINILDMVSF